MDVTYRTGDMSAYICVEKYLLHNGFKKALAELQSYKPLIVFDYLKKNGYENRSKQMVEVLLEKKSTKTKMKRKREEQVEPNPPKKAKQDQTPGQFDDEELNRLVPIADTFHDKVTQLEELERAFPGTELAKVAKFILDDNVNVKNSIALTISAQEGTTYSKRRFPFLKTSQLSGKSYGENSEESLLVKNWNQLLAKVPIYIPEKFVIDIQRITDTSHKWIQKLLGAYLSQGFVHHRCAMQFYTTLIGLKMRKGSLGEEEKEKLLEFVKKHIGKPTTKDWQKFSLEMGRQSKHLQCQLNILKESKDVSQTLKGSKYTLEEEVKILSYLDKHFDIGDPEKLKSFPLREFKPLVKVLQRGEMAIYIHYHGVLLPILLGNIYGSLNMEWESEFFNCIIDQKVKSISDIKWDLVLKQKPFLTRQKISLVLTNARNVVKVPGLLYEQITAYRSRITIRRSSPKWIEEHKWQVNQIYDDMIKAKSNKKLQKA